MDEDKHDRCTAVRFSNFESNKRKLEEDDIIRHVIIMVAEKEEERR